MSLLWSFHSFDEKRWNAIFGGDDPALMADVVNSATWDRDNESGTAAAREIAVAICKHGISYKSLNPESAETLDQIISGFFCPEGLEEALGIEYESPEGLHRDIVDEAIERLRQRPKPSFLKQLFSNSETPRPPRILPLLINGRRIGGGLPSSDAVYLVLSPSEVAELRSEVELSMSLKKYWSRSDNEFAAKELLLEPLQSIERKGSMLAARLG